jgi:hypothetical protein
MRGIVAKSVPRLLQIEQRQRRLEVCRELQQQLPKNSNFLPKVVTGDESLVYGHDPETKQQSSQWKSFFFTLPKKGSTSQDNINSLLSCLFKLAGLFTMSSSLLVRQSIKISVAMF